MGYALTEEQEIAVEMFATGRSLAIQAGAGAGKTSTLLAMAANAEKRPVTTSTGIVRARVGQYVAFNAPIVAEAVRKFPPSVKCNTAHSLAMKAVGHKYAHRLNSKKQKSADVAKRLGINPMHIQVQDGTTKYLSAGYLASLVMRSVKRFCQTADPEPTYRHVAKINGVDLPPESWENNDIVARAIEPAMKKAWLDLQNPNGTLHYGQKDGHTYYLKAWQLSNPVILTDYILFDEAQDANPVMLAIVAAQAFEREHTNERGVTRMIPPAQLVWVGDSQQQIYTFTGAVNALEKVGAEQTAYLTQSFRFGQAIADVANRVLTDLDAELRLTGTPALESTVGEIEKPHALLTRTNAAAMAALFVALEEGRTAHLVGGGKEVLSFAKAAKELQENGWTPHPELSIFKTWGEVQDFVEQDEDGGDLRLMVTLIDQFGVDEILDAVARMEKEDKADFVISTAHKSKGREWLTVKLAGDFPDEPNDEELRLLYVACTRAQMRLDYSAVGYLTQEAALVPAVAL